MMAILGDYAVVKALQQRNRKHPSYAEALYERVRPEFLSTDAYFIFSAIMARVPEFFSPSKKSMLDRGKTQRVEVLIEMVRFVQSKLLKEFDPDLHAVLEKCGVQPELYMLKWVRLLFSREFEVRQVLQVWDTLIQDGNITQNVGQGLVEYLCLTLIRHVRFELLNVVDATHEEGLLKALRSILHFPTVPDIQKIISQSISCREKYLSAHPVKEDDHAESKSTPKEPKSPKNAFDFLNTVFPVEKNKSRCDTTTFVKVRKEQDVLNESQESKSAFDFINA
eukprot:CAMPEP_0185271790 /NCGR_PEP_ID=MMETSP1359-20130426/45633_1 /TAXON_ID=552665 /ORGANISM="Bigelowiella longifila, Strain CCMP242" /LENGTH=279 /DNA_ID=CAMNT_0027863857 /DNA_START=106 /DNA_END=945 /DNA_ORIENTATION=+